MSILFAATYPERTRGLVLYGSNVTGRGDEDFPWAQFQTDEEIRKRLDETPWDSADQLIDALASGAPSGPPTTTLPLPTTTEPEQLLLTWGSDPAASITARTSSMRSSRVAIPAARSESPVPLLSKTITRAKLANRR